MTELTDLTFRAVRDWIQKHGPDLPLEEMHTLVVVAEEAAARCEKKDAARSVALVKMQEIAQQAGFESVEAMLRQQPAPAPRRQRQTEQVRKPHMNPLDPNAGEIYALTKHKILPAWADKLLAEGWTLHDFDYRNHAAAMRARGMEPLYDAIARHAEIVVDTLNNTRKK